MTDTPDDLSAVLAIHVGNSRTRLGLLRGASVESAESFDNADIKPIVARAAEWSSNEPDAVVALASVNRKVADALATELRASLGVEVYRLGIDLPIAIPNALDDDSTVGHDRLLAALGAYTRVSSACVVIDAGTAVTVDFVDGEGVFQGGAIAPGARMMLRALHEQTSALPKLEFAPQNPERGVFGKDTAHAMQLGVAASVRGLARHLVDQYAEAYGAYPPVLATGGDAVALFDGEPIIDRLDPDLQLVGIARSCQLALDDADDEDDL